MAIGSAQLFSEFIAKEFWSDVERSVNQTYTKAFIIKNIFAAMQTP